MVKIEDFVLKSLQKNANKNVMFCSVLTVCATLI